MDYFKFLENEFTQSARVCCPGRFNPEAPYHKWPNSKVLLRCVGKKLEKFLNQWKERKKDKQTAEQLAASLINHKISSSLIKDTQEQMVYISAPQPKSRQLNSPRVGKQITKTTGTRQTQEWMKSGENRSSPCIMCTFLPKFLREKQGCTLYMDITITHHGHNNGHNNPVCNAHKNVGTHCTWPNVVNNKNPSLHQDKSKIEVQLNRVMQTPLYTLLDSTAY